jgi:hypothetical protein
MGATADAWGGCCPAGRLRSVRAAGHGREAACPHAQHAAVPPLAVQARAAAEGFVFIAPYDDPYTIAGQGTVGNEILRWVPSPRPGCEPALLTALPCSPRPVRPCSVGLALLCLAQRGAGRTVQLAGPRRPAPPPQAGHLL